MIDCYYEGVIKMKIICPPDALQVSIITTDCELQDSSNRGTDEV